MDGFYYANRVKDFQALKPLGIKEKTQEDIFYCQVIDACQKCRHTIGWSSRDGQWWHQLSPTVYYKACRGGKNYTTFNNCKCNKPIASKKALEELRLLLIAHPAIVSC